jgi:hypothetical protein
MGGGRDVELGFEELCARAAADLESIPGRHCQRFRPWLAPAVATPTAETSQALSPLRALWRSGLPSIVILLTLATSARAAPSAFLPGPLAGVASAPEAIVAADFNHDGKADFAVATRTNSVSILLGTGRGHFTAGPGSPLAAGQGPISIAAGDFNLDGNQDLAVANFTDGTVTILLGDGHGGFSPAPGSPVSVGAGVRSVVAGVIGSTVQVAAGGPFGVRLISEGPGGTFTAGGDISGSMDASALAAGYFNDNGAPDIAVLNGVSNTVSMLLGDGSGNFTAAGPPVSIGESGGGFLLGGESIAAGDFNADGRQDVAVGLQDGKLSVLLGDGHGGLTLTSGSPSPILTDGTAPISLAAADLNGNGADDLAVADYWQGGPNVIYNSVSVLLSNRAGSFTEAAGSPYRISGVSTGAATGDVNGDGHLDVVAGDGFSCHGDAVVPLISQGSGGGTPAGGAFAGDGCPLPPSSPFASCAGSGAGPNPFVQGIEITQGVQTNNFPDTSEGCGAAPGFTGLHPTAQYPRGNPFNSDGTVRYVQLVAGRKTVVRVYAGSSFGRPLTPIVARLHAWQNGRLVGSTNDAPNPQAPDNGPLSPQQKSGGPHWSERTDPTGAFQFTIPEAWTHGDLTLVAQINPPNAAPSLTECPGCEVDDVFSLTKIHFIPTRPVFIRAVGLTAKGESLPPPEDVFMGLRAVLPVADDGLRTPVGNYDGSLIGNANQVCDNGGITGTPGLLSEWGATQTFGGGLSVNRAVGIYSGDQRFPAGSPHPGVDCQGGATQPGVGWESGYTGSALPGYPYEVAAASRPLTSVTHELLHSLGLPHAGHKCYYGGDASQQGASWPLDDQGYLQGIGTDVMSFSPTSNVYDIKAPSDPNAGYGQQLFDFMSYCIWDRTPGLDPTDGSDSMYQKGMAAVRTWEQLTWISPRTWDALVDRLAVPGASTSSARAPSTPATTAAASTLHVAVVPGASAPTINVYPGALASTPAGAATSYVLQSTASNGQVLTTVPLKAVEVHTDFQPNEIVLEGQLPARGVGGLRVMSGGHVIAQRTRPAHVPRVHVLTPGGRTVAQCRGRACTLRVRWRTTSGVGAGLQAMVDISSDGGRSWRTFYLGPDLGSVTIPDRLLGYSRRARIRVRLNDGFDHTAAVSAAFYSVGSPPTVSILSPRPGERIAQDGSLYLSGQASDDAGRAIVGGLSWYLGRRLLGVGPSISVAGLPAGSSRITLVARDRRGRTGSASVAVRGLAERPQFVVLHLPARVSPRSRRLLLRVSSLTPARLTVTGRGVRRARADVSRRVVTVAVKVTPGKQPLKLVLELANGRLHTVSRFLIRR